MTTYKKAHGVNVKSYNADPDRTYPSAFEGQLYYNSSDGQIKFIGLGAGAWASGGSLNTAAKDRGGVGLQTAALCFGGQISPPSTVNTEQYDGSSWTETSDMSTARYAMGSCGVYASAISAGGWVSPSHTNAVESWDGSSWTEISEINTSRNEIGGAGASNTSALIFGGVPNNPSVESLD